MATLINFSDTQPQTILPREGNASPYILTAAYTDLPTNHLINVQGFATLGLWIDFQTATGLFIRVLATETPAGANFYSLPIHTTYPEYVELKPQIFKLESGNHKMFVSLPMGGVVNYCKIQVKGTGQINGCIATLRGKLT